MKVKIRLAIALALGVLVAGCASHPEKIVFTDDPDPLSLMAAATAAPAQKRLERADELRIEQVVFSYLLERHFWDLADYSAVFLQAEDSQVTAMIKKYPDHVPPIKPSSRALIRSHRTPVDKDTHKPAMVLTVEVNEPNTDDTVDAVGRWFAGDDVTGFRAFHLTKVDGDWQIAEVK